MLPKSHVWYKCKCKLLHLLTTLTQMQTQAKVLTQDMEKFSFSCQGFSPESTWVSQATNFCLLVTGKTFCKLKCMAARIFYGQDLKPPSTFFSETTALLGLVFGLAQCLHLHITGLKWNNINMQMQVLILCLLYQKKTLTAQAHLTKIVS